MYLNKLLLKDYQQLNKEISLSAGVNVLCVNKNKNVLKDFISGILYGGSGHGGQGKAYLVGRDKKYFVERDFLKHSNKVDVIDVDTGREIRLRHNNSLVGTLFDMDKNTYQDAMCIKLPGNGSRDELADELNSYVTCMCSSGTASIDAYEAVEKLEAKKQSYVSSALEDEISLLQLQLDEIGEVDDSLKRVQGEIKKNEQELAERAEERKRERGVEKLLNAGEDIDNKPSKLTDRLWFILLVGIFVVGLVALMVNLLQFEKPVRQLFIITTILFVIVTIVEGLYQKGFFSGDVALPSEDEFKSIIDDIQSEFEEGDEAAAAIINEYNAKRESLEEKKQRLLDSRKRQADIKDRLELLQADMNKRQAEISAIDMALTSIRDISFGIEQKITQKLNFADMAVRLTGGKVRDISYDREGKLRVLTADEYEPLTTLETDVLKQVYVAVRLAMTRACCQDKLPVIIDCFENCMDKKDVAGLLKSLKSIDTEQVIILTEEKRTRAIMDSVGEKYSYTELNIG